MDIRLCVYGAKKRGPKSGWGAVVEKFRGRLPAPCRVGDHMTSPGPFQPHTKAFIPGSALPPRFQVPAVDFRKKPNPEISCFDILGTMFPKLNFSIVKFVEGALSPRNEVRHVLFLILGGWVGGWVTWGPQASIPSPHLQSAQLNSGSWRGKCPQPEWDQTPSLWEEGWPALSGSPDLEVQQLRRVTPR